MSSPNNNGETKKRNLPEDETKKTSYNSRLRKKNTNICYTEDNINAKLSIASSASLNSKDNSNTQSLKDNSKEVSINNKKKKNNKNGNNNSLLNNTNELINFTLESIIDLEDAYLARDGGLHLSNGQAYYPGNHVFLICEPPGEPYYIARIMEFVNKSDSLPFSQNTSNFPIPAKDVLVRVNWFYRPRDISRKSTDSRQLFVTMHCDVCHLSSIRGKCTVKHRDHIENFDLFKKHSNNFWFENLYDRYIQRFYDIIPTEKILNLPPKVRKVLMSRIKYAVVEAGRGKELCSAAKSCKICFQWCSPDDSIECANCHDYYHMLCVRPPLLKKPSRGFAWCCVSCTIAQEKKIREYNPGPVKRSLRNKSDQNLKNGDSLLINRNGTLSPEKSKHNTDINLNDENDESFPDDIEDFDDSDDEKYKELQNIPKRQEILEKAFDTEQGRATPEQARQARLWPYRYLGIHSKIEDLLDRDDRIYPRASSRLGSKHQCVVPDWYGHPVQYISGNNDSKKSKKTHNDSSSNNSITSSPWIIKKPAGFVERGGDSTITVIWKNPTEDEDSDKKVDHFMQKTKPFAKKLKIGFYSSNFMDACLKAYLDSSYTEEKALKTVASLRRKSLKEPTFNEDEVKRFEAAVAKYGSELHPVYLEVKTQSSANVVRFYYLWKKTDAGKRIWGNFEGRKGGKAQVPRDKNGNILDDIADKSDDSAFDEKKSKMLKKRFSCKFCKTTSSIVWRRAPGVSNTQTDPVIALCSRCARLWRRYAIVWEEPEEVMKKSLRGGSTWRKGIEAEVIEDCRRALLSVTETNGHNFKLKAENFAQTEDLSKKCISEETKIEAPIKLTCSLCNEEDFEIEILSCVSCKINVHKECYGAILFSPKSDWTCDVCLNQRNPSLSNDYECVLCFPENKSDQNESIEKKPAELLKSTIGNNWMHLKCCLWIPYLKFIDSIHMKLVQGIESIPAANYTMLCKICQSSGFPCLSCSICAKSFHVKCASNQNYRFLFELFPIKTNKKDTNLIEIAGNNYCINPIICCPDHDLQGFNYYKMHEKINGEFIMQIYVSRYKQADLSYSGASRRARNLSTALVRNIIPVKGSCKLIRSNKCYYCHTDSSPFWWKCIKNESICQNCYWNYKT